MRRGLFFGMAALLASARAGAQEPGEYRSRLIAWNADATTFLYATSGEQQTGDGGWVRSAELVVAAADGAPQLSIRVGAGEGGANALLVRDANRAVILREEHPGGINSPAGVAMRWRSGGQGGVEICARAIGADRAERLSACRDAVPIVQALAPIAALHLATPGQRGTTSRAGRIGSQQRSKILAITYTHTGAGGPVDLGTVSVDPFDDWLPRALRNPSAPSQPMPQAMNGRVTGVVWLTGRVIVIVYREATQGHTAWRAETAHVYDLPQ